MKTKFLFFCLIILLGFNNRLTAQNYFPLKAGNAYQIRNDYSGYSHGGYSGTNYNKISVLQDSLINGEVFYLISSTALYRPFGENTLLKYDSLNQKVFIRNPNDDSTRLAFDINTLPDSHYISYIRGVPIEFISEGLSFQTVLGDTQITYSMKYFAPGVSIPRYIYYVSDQIGLSRFKYYWADVSSHHSSNQYVISAIIDSIIYNPLTLEVTGLSPLIDRPIDTFPFVINGSYSASIPKLVDSFYVSIIQTRADSIIRSWVMEFESGLAFVPIYSSMLQVGDKIKVRAKATDESIFENVAYYPDTGYAIITVLPSTVGIKTEEEKFIYMLGQNYPNPFNPITTIIYEVPNSNFVTLKIYNTLSEEITTLVNEEKSAGSYRVEFNGNDLPSGIYFYRLTSGGYSQSRKMLLIK